MATAQPSLRAMIMHDDEPVYAPLVLNPLMAKLAEQAGKSEYGQYLLRVLRDAEAS